MKEAGEMRKGGVVMSVNYYETKRDRHLYRCLSFT